MSAKGSKGVLHKFFVGDGVNSGLLTLFDKIVSVAAMVLSSIFIWMIFVLCFKNNMPIVVVLSNSMEPDFIRGDILLAVSKPRGEMFPIGEICAYNVDTAAVPIVHRMIETHHTGKDMNILTKGDNNDRPDNWLYRGAEFYRNSEVETRLIGVLPKLGWVSIAVKERKEATFLFLGILIWNSFRSPDD